jgi:hypothetical protein
MSDPQTPRPNTPPTWEERIGRIDRRLIYGLLFLATLTPLVFGLRLPLYVTEDAQNLYQTIERLPPDKMVLLFTDWEAGTIAENRPQNVAIARHLLRRHIPFALLSINSQTSPQVAEDAVQEAIRAEGHGIYGVDYCNFGYRVGTPPWLQALAGNLVQSVSTELKGRPLAELPMMRGVTTIHDNVSLTIDITATNTINDLIPMIHAATGVPMGLACTAVMAPEAYPYLDSGQLVGMLTGMRGAAEYEILIGAPGFGVTAMAGQSAAHLFILGLIALGNLPILAAAVRKRGRRQR